MKQIMDGKFYYLFKDQLRIRTEILDIGTSWKRSSNVKKFFADTGVFQEGDGNYVNVAWTSMRFGYWYGFDKSGNIFISIRNDYKNGMAKIATLNLYHFLMALSQFFVSAFEAGVVEFVAPETEEDENDTSDPIEYLDLSVGAYNCLRRAGIRTVKQLSKLKEEDLLPIRNLGRERCNEIRRKLFLYRSGL